MDSNQTPSTAATPGAPDPPPLAASDTRPSHTRHRFWRPLVLVLGFAISAAIAGVIHDMLGEEAAAQREIGRQSLAAGLQTRIDSELSFVGFLRGLYNSSDFVSAAEFRRFTQINPDIRDRQWWFSVAWAPRKAAAGASANALPGAGDAFPITYLQPDGANTDAMIDGDRITMQAALSTLRLTLSEPRMMTLNGHPGMVVKAFLPVFKNDPDGAPGNLQGFLIAVIGLDGFFNAFLDDTFDSTDLPVRIYDGNRLVFQHGALIHPLSPTAIVAGNRQWRLEVDAEMQPIESTLWLPLLVFAIGLALTALLYLRLLRADTEYRRIADEVGRATSALAGANHRLAERTATLQRVVDDLQRTSQEAQIANAAKTMFLANMSHELRTPLNAVIGFSEMIASRSLGENWSRYMEYAKDILTSGRYLLSIIEDLLDMSRIELGQIELREEVIAPAELAQSAAKFIAHRARERRSNIELVELDGLPPVMIDVRAMRQSLTNLLTNAVKFSAPGALIEIRGKLTQEGEVCLSVNDNGPGIKASELQHIFEPFWQNEAYRRRPRDGVGLGLAITKRLVEAHGGTITIESKEGAGTRIEIRLPSWRAVRNKPQFTVVQGDRGTSAA